MGHGLTLALEVFKHFVLCFHSYKHIIRQSRKKPIANREKLYAIREINQASYNLIIHNLYILYRSYITQIIQVFVLPRFTLAIQRVH